MAIYNSNHSGTQLDNVLAWALKHMGVDVSALYELVQNAIATMKSSLSDMSAKLTIEQKRATDAESDLDKKIEAETTRAKEAEAPISTHTSQISELSGSLGKEISRAKTAEDTKVDKSDYQNDKTELTNMLISEQTRAKAAEADLTKKTQDLEKWQTDADENKFPEIHEELDTKMTQDGFGEWLSKSYNVDKAALSKSISDETTRAKGVEEALEEKVTALKKIYLTQDEYDALETKEENVEYDIIEDE